MAVPLVLIREPDLGYGTLVLAILVVNLGILARLWLREKQVRFGRGRRAAARTFRQPQRDRSARADRSGPLDFGQAGEVLVRENQAAPSLFYLAEGQATIRRDGVDVEQAGGRRA